MSKSKRLDRYRDKRKAARTPEPFGSSVETGGNLFVVQQHAARRLHWDFRIELDGVLQSWAVPRGPSYAQKDKRLAVHVEDHPLEYAQFEGQIPEGNYGAGTVILWDRGTWHPLEDPHDGFRKGKLLFELFGYKLRGKWTLVKIKKTEKEWLLIKERDSYMSNESPGIEAFSPQSILSGQELEELKRGSQREKKILTSLKKTRTPTKTLSASDFKPMLATARPKPFDNDQWAFEMKYDGYRMICVRDDGDARLISRNGFDYTDYFPEIRQTLLALPFSRFAIDGEVVVLDPSAKPSFALLQKRAKLNSDRAIQVASIQSPASLFAFDILSLGDFDLRSRSLLKRKEVLKKIIPHVGPVRYSEHFVGKGRALWEQILELRLEGIVAKKIDSTYRSERSDKWLKIRADKSGDFVIVGYTEGSRSRPGFGALLVGAYRGKKLIYCGRVGTGFSTKQLNEIAAQLTEAEISKPACQGELPTREVHWVKPEQVVEVRYKELNEHLRHPAFLRVRTDKTAKECSYPKETTIDVTPPGRTKKKNAEKKVTLSNLDKVFWPEERYTKGDLIEYYRSVGPWILKFLKDRPLVLTRYPDGIHGKSFFQKDAPVFVPDWIRTEGVWTDHTKREIKYFVCNDLPSLTYVINMGTIPLHIWASHSPTLEQADWCVLDLDPKGAPFRDVVKIALAIRDLCRKIKLEPFVKTSGSTGLHVMLPLPRQTTHEQSKTLGELLANVIAGKLPDIATTVRNPQMRQGKVYIDFLQNGHGKTIAAPYCVRPLPGAPVSAPLKWAEVNPKLKINQFTIKTMPARLKKMKADPLLPILKSRPQLEKILKDLAALIN